MSQPLSVTLLGPQRLAPMLGEVVADLGLDGPLAVITAGWQEREREDEELLSHLGGRGVNLSLYHRALDVFLDDSELAEAISRRQRKLKDLQEMYRLRLGHALDVVRELHHRTAVSTEIVVWSAQRAMAAVRELDAEHLEHQQEVHQSFRELWQPRQRPALVRHCAEVAEIMDRCQGVLIAGGHVAVLLNRLRLFGLADLVAGKRIIAWSAGAMALSQRVVLFHDSPPQGRGYAEVLESGLGLTTGVIPFPNARHRLNLGDPDRVTLISRRFEPDLCLAMNEGARLDWNGERGWQPVSRIVRLGLDGQTEAL